MCVRSKFKTFLPPANEVAGRFCFYSCLFLHSVLGWGGLPQCMLGYHPREQTPPPPPRSRHPPCAVHAGRYNKRAVCILLECNLVQTPVTQCKCFEFFCMKILVITVSEYILLELMFAHLLLGKQCIWMAEYCL